MDRAMNTLPIQTYVRQRVETIVIDIGNASSGSVPLELDKPSDVTIVIVSDTFLGQPALFVAAINRVPDLSDFDVVISPVDGNLVKYASRVTLRLPAGSALLRWRSLSKAGNSEAFPAECSRLVLAVDQ